MYGRTKGVDLLSVVDNQVIKPSVKLRQSNIKLFQVTRHFTPETENAEFYDVTKKYDLIEAITSLNRLICYK